MGPMALPHDPQSRHREGMSTEVTTHPASGHTTIHHRIVVGFDGSAGSIDAIEWAAREAEHRSSELRVVTCSAVPADVDFYGVGARQHQRLDAVVADARARHPDLAIDAAATHLDPRDALIAETERSDLLVIGSSQAGTIRKMLLGSITRTAARRSACPVVVMNGSADRPIDKIVIGVDGSSAAAHAVDWGCAEASRHGSTVTIVHVREASGCCDDAQRVLENAVAECRDRTMSPVTALLAEGTAAGALVRASGDADLVVIGSRGRSGFKTALFGSVALTVAENAACPVAITHPRIRHD
jgi:nucleotide-binding universal stress UspA family protein